jgi:hypothetical protein
VYLDRGTAFAASQDMRVAAVLAAVAMAAAMVGDTSASTVTVHAGEDLQQILNAARPGDTILLERGATFTGNFVLPPRLGDDDRDIVLRTAGDADLPAEGERMAPPFAPQLAKLQSPNGSPALQAAPASRHWRIMLLEFGANRDGAGDIIALGEGSSAQGSLAQVPSFFTLDRLYIHGDAGHGQKRAIALNSSDTVITGCYVADIKRVGQDSQAIAGWNGAGRYTIENNYLEAASENIMFGGADPSIIGLTPTTIVVRRNLLSKPLAWREPGAPNWQVKNLFELKNARDVLVEGNVMEHNWPQGQSGYAVLFTVRNQDGGCPWCQVEDVRFRRNIVRDVAAGVQILGSDNVHPSRQTNRIAITDNVFDGIDRKAWGGDGYFLQLSDNPRDITIDHNTIVQGSSGGIIKMAHGATDGFRFTNNIASHGDYGMIGTDHAVGNDSIAAYLPGAEITNNVIAGGDSRRYPPGNFFPSLDELRRQFAAFASHVYVLAESSAWKKAGTDGRDLGANLGEGLAMPRTPDAKLPPDYRRRP